MLLSRGISVCTVLTVVTTHLVPTSSLAEMIIVVGNLEQHRHIYDVLLTDSQSFRLEAVEFIPIITGNR